MNRYFMVLKREYLKDTASARKKIKYFHFPVGNFCKHNTLIYKTARMEILKAKNN